MDTQSYVKTEIRKMGQATLGEQPKDIPMPKFCLACDPIRDTPAPINDDEDFEVHL